MRRHDLIKQLLATGDADTFMERTELETKLLSMVPDEEVVATVQRVSGWTYQIDHVQRGAKLLSIVVSEYTSPVK